MSHYPYDPEELERLLHQRLHNFAPEAPEHIWSVIETHLPEQSRLVWRQWLAGMCLLAFLGSLQYHNRSLKNTPASPATDRLIAAATPCTTPGSVKKKEPDRFFPKQPEISTHPRTPAYTDRAPEKISSAYSAPDKKPVVAPVLPHLLTNTFNAPVTSITQQLVAPALPRHVPPPAVDLKTPEKSPGKKRFTVGIHTGPVWAWQKNTAPAPHHGGQVPAYSETVEAPVTGWQAGVSLAYGIAPNWRLETGFAQRRETLRTTYHATLRLNDGICLNPYDIGVKHYNFNYTTSSEGNNSFINVRISQVDSAVIMPAEEAFHLDMHTTRRHVSWILPLSVSRSFTFGRWKGLTRGGLSMNFLSSTTAELEHFSEACLELCYSPGQIPSVTVAPTRRFSIQFLLGTGLEYQLTPRSSLRIEPTVLWQKSKTTLTFDTGVLFHF